MKLQQSMEGGTSSLGMPQHSVHMPMQVAHFALGRSPDLRPNSTPIPQSQWWVCCARQENLQVLRWAKVKVIFSLSPSASYLQPCQWHLEKITGQEVVILLVRKRCLLTQRTCKCLFRSLPDCSAAVSFCQTVVQSYWEIFFLWINPP